MSTKVHNLPRVRASELVGRGWLNTGGRHVTLAELRGKVVVLDFWTFCCINCLHVLDELREVEEQHRDELVIIGVHSPKFEHEADPDALAAAVERYEVRHAVLDDPELVTWGAYTARAWPTLVVIDPEGYIVAQMAGEGHGSAIAALVGDLIAEHAAKGTLHRGVRAVRAARSGVGHAALPREGARPAEREPPGRGRRAPLARRARTRRRDAGPAHRLGRARAGRRRAGRGAVPRAERAVPGARGPPGALGYDVVVADTVNHALRACGCPTARVTTVAGTGQQFMVGGQENVALQGEWVGEPE